MKVLLLEKSPVPQIAAALGGGVHRVTAVKEDKAALQAFAAESFEVVVISMRGADEALLALPKAARRGPSAGAVFFVLLAAECPEEYLVRAYEAGIDASLRMPCGAALVLAQLRSVERFVSVAGGDGEPAAAPASPLDQVYRSNTWRTAQAQSQSIASKFLTLDVEPAQTDAVTAVTEHACMITLSNAQHQLEMRIALGTDAVSGKHLAVHLFGPEGIDLIPDMLSELANNVMGALKTSFSKESLAFTGGLPQQIEVKEVLRPTVTYAHQAAFALRMADAAILVHLSIRGKSNLILRPATLREGMILSKDVFNARGLLMLQGGTRLSLNMIEKIVSTLPEKSQLEVMAA